MSGTEQNQDQLNSLFVSTRGGVVSVIISRGCDVIKCVELTVSKHNAFVFRGALE